MIDELTLQQVVARIVAEAQPSRVILFGSYGRGEAGPGSDLDIMVVKPHVPNRYEEMIRLRKAVGSIGAGIDLLVYSEAEYERRSQVPGTVLYWARKEGRPLYAATWVTDVRRWAEELVHAAAESEQAPGADQV